jgi:hypothetical protein
MIVIYWNVFTVSFDFFSKLSFIQETVILNLAKYSILYNNFKQDVLSNTFYPLEYDGPLEYGGLGGHAVNTNNINKKNIYIYL